MGGGAGERSASGAKRVRTLLLGHDVAGILASKVNAILCQLIPSESRGAIYTRGVTKDIQNAAKQEAGSLVR